MNIQRHLLFILLCITSCSPAAAVSCRNQDIKLGDSFTKVIKLCDDAAEYVYSYTQEESITNDDQGQVKLTRDQYDTDALVYYDLQHHLKVTFTFRRHELTDIVSERIVKVKSLS